MEPDKEKTLLGEVGNPAELSYRTYHKYSQPANLLFLIYNTNFGYEFNF